MSKKDEVMDPRCRVMVWPLRQGLQGYDRLGEPALLKAGERGWMHVDVVDASVERGEVQKMAGLRVSDLKTPDMTPVKPKRKRGRPSKADIAARKAAEEAAAAAEQASA